MTEKRFGPVGIIDIGSNSVRFVAYGGAAAWKSWHGGALSIKTLVMPEWWFLLPLPLCFALLAVEFVFRMRRLAGAAAGPRDDAVSAA